MIVKIKYTNSSEINEVDVGFVPRIGERVLFGGRFWLIKDVLHIWPENEFWVELS